MCAKRGAAAVFAVDLLNAEPNRASVVIGEEPLCKRVASEGGAAKRSKSFDAGGDQRHRRKQDRRHPEVLAPDDAAHLGGTHVLRGLATTVG